MVERRFPRQLGSLEPMTRFVAEYVASRGLDPEHSYTLDLLVEELFTNMLKYGQGGGPEVSLGLDGEGDEVLLILRDFDVESFDPSVAPIAYPERPGGGRGLRLVRQMSDSVRYEYRDRTAITTLRKRFPR